MRNYTDKELIERVKVLPSYNWVIPKYLIIGVRSKEDTPNVFDDKMYVFIDGVFKMVASCTTNPGSPTLLGGWKKYNKNGAAILKSDEIYYDAYRKSNGGSIQHHNGKMPCLRQVSKMFYFRDGNNNNKSDEVGDLYFDNYSTNIHFNNYDLKTKIIGTFVNGWSAGCQVLNNAEQYNELLSLMPEKESITYCLLKEFNNVTDIVGNRPKTIKH